MTDDGVPDRNELIALAKDLLAEAERLAEMAQKAIDESIRVHGNRPAKDVLYRDDGRSAVPPSAGH